MNFRILNRMILLIAAFNLTACKTVKLPDFEKLKMSGWFDEIRNVEGYPDISAAPAAPNDLRSLSAWDEDAKELVRLQDGFGAVISGESLGGTGDVVQDIEALRAKVHAYKADNPQ